MNEEILIIEELLEQGFTEQEIMAELMVEADLQSKMPTFIKQVGKIGITDQKKAQEKVEEINQADPTGKQANYTQWLIKMATIKSLTFPEDIPKAKGALETFEKIKKNPNTQINKDIMSYKTFGDLYKVVSEAGEEELSKGERKRQRTIEGIKEVYNDGTYKVFQISTGEASRKYCKQYWEDGKSPWCFISEDTGNHYINEIGGDIFAIEKNGEPYMAFHMASRQLEDANGDFPDVDDPEWKEVYPILNKVAGVIVLELEDEVELADDIEVEEETETEPSKV